MLPTTPEVFGARVPLAPAPTARQAGESKAPSSKCMHGVSSLKPAPRTGARAPGPRASGAALGMAAVPCRKSDCLAGWLAGCTHTYTHIQADDDT